MVACTVPLDGSISVRDFACDSPLHITFVADVRAHLGGTLSGTLTVTLDEKEISSKRVEEFVGTTSVSFSIDLSQHHGSYMEVELRATQSHVAGWSMYVAKDAKGMVTSPSYVDYLAHGGSV